MAEIEQADLTKLTVDLLSAYFATNTLDSAQLPGLIQSTHDALKGIDSPPPEPEPEPEFTPKVGIRKSLSSKDHIISLIDGKPYKMLRRHLARHDLTPEQYRERYKLPSDYPMVAANYSEARKAMAQKIGLGRKAAQSAPIAASETADTTTPKTKRTPAKAKTATKPSAKAAPAKAPKTSGTKSPAPAAPPAAEPTIATSAAAVPKKRGPRKVASPDTPTGAAPKPANRRGAPKAKAATAASAD